MIPLARPALGDREVDAVAAVLRSGMLVQGPLVERFEALLAERCARRFGVAVSSGTAALLPCPTPCREMYRVPSPSSPSSASS